MIDVKELRRLLVEATPVPWVVTVDDVIVGDVKPGRGCTTVSDNDMTEENAATVVAAVNALPSLLDRLDLLEGALRECEETLKSWVDEHGAPHSGYTCRTHWVPCPQDETCDCELVAEINAALARAREVLR